MASVGNVITGIKRTGNNKHYTEKPVDLFRYLLENDASGGRGDFAVYDAFAGSCTVVMAAESLGRASLAIDVEPRCLAAGLERVATETPYTPERIE